MPVSEFAGRLDQRIELWERSPERSETGSSSEELRLVLRCHAAITAEGGGAAVEAMTMSAMPRFRVTVRTRAEIAVGQEVRWRGRALQVRQLVDDSLLPDRLVLHCEEQRP